MAEELNPIESSIKWLMSCGFTDEEAENICTALHASSGEKLWKDAPEWIEWCGETRKNYECIVDLAAKGILTVELSEGGIADLGNLQMSLRTEK